MAGVAGVAFVSCVGGSAWLWLIEAVWKDSPVRRGPTQPEQPTFRGADGRTYMFSVCPAKKPGMFFHGGIRIWSLISRDASWWLNLERDDVMYPILRERFVSEEGALKRADALRAALIRGSIKVSTRTPWQRRSGSPQPKTGGAVPRRHRDASRDSRPTRQRRGEP